MRVEDEFAIDSPRDRDLVACSSSVRFLSDREDTSDPFLDLPEDDFGISEHHGIEVCCSKTSGHGFTLNIGNRFRTIQDGLAEVNGDDGVERKRLVDANDHQNHLQMQLPASGTIGLLC